MTIVCAWCRSVLGTKPGPEDAVTHGICAECRREMEARLRAPADAGDDGDVRVVTERIDMMLRDGTRPELAVAMDGEGRILGAAVIPEGRS